MTLTRYANQHCATEWTYSSGKAYPDPYNDVELDVFFKDSDGGEWRVPAFWRGGQTWGVRFAPRLCGTYRFRTLCSDRSNPDLHEREGELIVTPYEGSHPLLRHGPLRVHHSGRYLEHLDGTPFFWLGDTWWAGLSRQISWPDGYRLLTADRAAKGFSVVQIVVGLFGMYGSEQFGRALGSPCERFANEAGFAWEGDCQRINPAYFEIADLRIEALVRAGLVPCILSGWGHTIHWIGTEQMKRYWRYLIGRYGAYPVVWCLAGEASKWYYLSQNPEQDSTIQRREWTRIASYVREIDPYRHPLTIHPRLHACSRTEVEDPGFLDLDMLQTGHDDTDSLAPTVEGIVRSVSQHPPLPVINAEVCYEGWSGANGPGVQRLMFWSCLLSGAAGYTYGAEGIWQANSREFPFQPYVDPPEGAPSFWSDPPWEEMYQLPGATQVALGKQFLERFEWWRFEPHPEWIEPHWCPENYYLPYGGGIPGEVRLIYFPWKTYRAWRADGFTLKGLERGVRYQAWFWDPTNGNEYPFGTVEGNAAGNAKCPYPPLRRDWVLVLERVAD